MLQEKVDSALKIIREGLEKGKPVVAFSGGKDSTVVLHLVRSLQPKTPALFADTGVEAKETRDFCETVPFLHTVSYWKSFWQCVNEYGWPNLKNGGRKGKIWDKAHGNHCCLYTKHGPMELWEWQNDINVCFRGETVEESRSRLIKHKQLGALYQKTVKLPAYRTKKGGVKIKIWQCKPIWNWTTKDVWEYIKENGLRYNPLYDKGAVRVGCVPCTAYLSWKERLAKENPKMLRVILRKMGQNQLKGVLI